MCIENLIKFKLNRSFILFYLFFLQNLFPFLYEKKTNPKETLWHFNLNIFTKLPFLFLPPCECEWKPSFVMEMSPVLQSLNALPVSLACRFHEEKKRTLLFTVPLREC